MTVTVTRSVEVDVEVDLNDFDDTELIDELEDRGYTVLSDWGTTNDAAFLNLYYAYLNDKDKFHRLFSNFVYNNTGRIIP